MPKDSGGGSVPISPSDKQQAKILKEIEATFGKPMRDVISPQAIGALANQNAFSTEMPGSTRDTYERQFDVAKRNIMNEAGGRGGMLRQSLVNNENSRAGTIAKATDDYRQLGIERALGLIPSALPNANAQMQARGQIASNQNAINTANAQMANQGSQSMMSGLGGLAGLMLGGPAGGGIGSWLGGLFG
jgi:hypothetical protein